VLEIEAVDAGGGQITADSTLEDVKNIDFGKVNPVTGPVYVAGAEPGDALKVTIVSLRASGWGWSAVIPGFGLLADQFEDPALYIWQYDPETLAPAPYLKGAKVPLKPFPGTIGVAPAPQGQHSVVNPRKVGGNMDTRDLSAGAVLYLPVEVPGALFSLGDAHAAQGDGEVCGTAIESPMQVTVKLEVAKGMNLRFPRFTTPGPVSRHFDKNGYEVTTGIGPDLMESARAAVSDMVDLVADRHGYSRAEAYMLCSVCADLRISEIVDAPDWIVSFYFPKIVFA
jgi:acetamidase/formamidase